MSVYTDLHHCVTHLGYIDIIEIIFFSTLIYYASVWLRKDRYAPLLMYGYAYCSLMIIAYIAALESVLFFLTFFAPAICICFIMIHQTTLQKNYIMLKNPQPINTIATDPWIDYLMRICLQAMHNNISLTCIIEQSDSLRSVLHTDLELNIPLQSGILEMLIKAPTFSSERLIWLNDQGIIIGINATWQKSTPVLSAYNNEHTLIQETVLYSAHTDALFITTDLSTHDFTMIVAGNIYRAITAPIVINSIKKYVNDKKSIQKGDTHGSHHQRTTHKEYHS